MSGPLTKYGVSAVTVTNSMHFRSRCHIAILFSKMHFRLGGVIPIWHHGRLERRQRLIDQIGLGIAPRG